MILLVSVVLVATALISLLLTAWMARTARGGEVLLDVPNERSSHTSPTPRGGGIVFSGLFLAAAAVCLSVSIPHRELWIALVGGGSVVALVGWLDDWRGLPSFARLGLYAVAAAWATYWIGGLPVLSLGFVDVRFGLVGHVAAWGFILAFTNIYNFMDGIDGIAASEGITVSVTAGVLLLASGEPYVGWLLIGLAMALLGFLRWNWSPARVFMGDVGSNMLGFVFATAALAMDQLSSVSVWVWAILLGVFVVDGFLTFGRRLARRLPPYKAHRSHAYQGAVQMGHSHAVVSLAIIGINIVLGGIAAMAWLCPAGAIPLLVVSYAGLAVLHMRYSPLGEERQG